ncbi:MAG: hypothetical protein HYR90_00290 [Candidatus Andersenbacteria bacterium]|nr:hypothetical protein [Candidatus Andersenbacteria bacterium]MBI3250677.1 hypothetical protein [Candidatus Andersenbacteria bacterium]
MSVTTKAILPALTYILIFLRPLCTVCNAPSVPELMFVLLVLLPAAFVYKKFLNSFSVLALVAVLSLHAQWGILQFAVQQDFNLYLLGESPLSSRLPGIAKFSLGSEKVLRGYGPYSHANVFGGAMLVGLILVNTLPRNRSTFLIGSFFLLALLLSFSRTAYAGYILYVLLGAFRSHRSYFKKLLIPVLICIVVAPLVWLRGTDTASRAFSERWHGYAWSFAIMQQQSLVRGASFGNYKDIVKHYLEQNNVPHEMWEIAPVHSVPLLLAIEVGIIPTIILILLFITGIGLTNITILFALVPPLLFDHYFVTELSSLFLLVVLYTASHGGGISSKHHADIA